MHLCPYMHVDKYANGPDKDSISDLTRGDVAPLSSPVSIVHHSNNCTYT